MLKNSFPQQISLGNSGDRRPTRLGFQDENGQCFLPPLSAKRFSVWAKKFQVSEEAQEAYRKGIA